MRSFLLFLPLIFENDDLISILAPVSQNMNLNVLWSNEVGPGRNFCTNSYAVMNGNERMIVAHFEIPSNLCVPVLNYSRKSVRRKY